MLAGEWRPDLAILDVKMPVLDGVEAARRINAAAPLPIVLLTAYADEGTIARAVGAGVFGYLIKPFRESEIAPAIEMAWARHTDWLTTRRELGRQADPGDGDGRRRRRRHAPLPAAHRAARRRTRRRQPDGRAGVAGLPGRNSRTWFTE